MTRTYLCPNCGEHPITITEYHQCPYCGVTLIVIDDFVRERTGPIWVYNKRDNIWHRYDG